MHYRQKKVEIAQRQQIVAALYLQGKTQHEISLEVGRTQAQISYDLKAIQQIWADKAAEAIGQKKAEELAKIDRLERTYWDGWERSLLAFKAKIVKGKKSKVGKGAEDIEQTLKEEERIGDPRFLAGVQWCIERRLKLFGLEAPQKWAPTDPTGEKPYQMLNEEELVKRFMGILNGAAKTTADSDSQD